jgi:hypothetical protein
MPKSPVPISGTASSVLLGERLRIASIVESPEGLARPAAALQLALRSTMDVQSSIEMLRTIPVTNPYIAAMALEGAVNVNSVGGSSVGGDDAKTKRLAELRTNIGGLKTQA